MQKKAALEDACIKSLKVFTDMSEVTKCSDMFEKALVLCSKTSVEELNTDLAWVVCAMQPRR